jgi:hypothetical protein
MSSPLHLCRKGHGDYLYHTNVRTGCKSKSKVFDGAALSPVFQV